MQEIIRTTELGQAVESKFKSFARSVMLTEKKWFSSWSDSINGVAMQHLKQTIFRRSAATSESLWAGNGDSGQLGRSSFAPAHLPHTSEQTHTGILASRTWNSHPLAANAACHRALTFILYAPVQLRLPSDRVEVNFHPDLVRLIRETRYLDRMGFPIPEIALNVALQEDKFLQWLEGLNSMLFKYYEVRAQRCWEVGWH